MNARAAIVAIAPIVLAFGLIYHPFVPNLTDASAVAAAAGEDTTRWAVSHLAVGVASGFVMLAFLAVRSYLRDSGEELWSRRGLPLVVFGSALFAILPGMEITLLGVVETGGDVAGVQAAIDPWFLPLMMTGAVTFAIGAIFFAVAIRRSDALEGASKGLVVAALVVLAFARFVPLGAVQFHVASAAAIGALWPLAFAMARRPIPETVTRPRALAA